MEVVCLGEAMLRQSPGGLGEISTPGGSELNVAVSLAMLERKVGWISALGVDAAGERIRRDALSAGVDFSFVKTLPHPTGTYRITPLSKSPIYQRENSSFANLTPQHFDDLMRPIFAGARWLHLTGITPLLGENSKSLWATAMGWAELDGFLISLDLNHRPSLGSWDQLWSLIEPKLRQIHALHLSPKDLQNMSKRGLISTPLNLDESNWNGEGIEEAILEVRKKFALTWVTCTHKTDTNGQRRRWSAMSSVSSTSTTTSRNHPSNGYLAEHLGGGDAWVAAWLDGMLSGLSEEVILQRADRYATMAQSVIGDFSTITREALEDGVCKSTLSTLQGGEQVGKPVKHEILDGVIAILRGYSPSEAEQLAAKLVDRGCKAIEVTLDSEQPYATIEAVRAASPPRVIVGVGTISDPLWQIPRAKKHGASFALSPKNPKKMVGICQKHDLLAIPGVANIEEAEAAIAEGALALKLFHWKNNWVHTSCATVLKQKRKLSGINESKGFNHEKDLPDDPSSFSIQKIRKNNPNISLLPVGGIHLSEVPSLLEEGYTACGIGSHIKEIL